MPSLSQLLAPPLAYALQVFLHVIYKNITALYSVIIICVATFQVYTDLFVDETYGRNCKCSTAHCELLLPLCGCIWCLFKQLMYTI